MFKSETSVLERQRARVKCRRRYADCRSLSPVSTPASRVDDFQDLVASSGRHELARHEISSSEFPSNLAVSTTTTTLPCSPPPEANSRVTGENPKKRKVKSRVENEKKMKMEEEEEEESKLDYVHVRARRGQATDSHSLAERARREKISERMKYLQNLVPGCNKIAGKAGMLDEIINYVQSLQQQVELLSMKVATLNPRLDFINVDHHFGKQVFPTIEISPETANSSSYYNQLGIGSSSVTVPETPLINSASITHLELCSTWGNDLQRLYSMIVEEGGPPLLSPSSFLSQQYSGIEDENETFVEDKDVVVPF